MSPAGAITAARPEGAARGGLSARLAALRLDEIPAAALARLVADEALAAMGGSRAAVWVYRPGLDRLLLEQDGLEVESLEVSSADDLAVLDHEEVWREPLAGLRARLVEASFGAALGDRRPPVLALPLRAGEETAGLLLLDDPGDAVDAGSATARPFVDQAAALIHNHARHTWALRNEANLQALYETAGELSANLDLGTVLRAIAKRARVLLDAPISHVMLADEPSAEIAMRVSDGTSHPSFDTLRLKLGLGLGGRVAERRSPFYTSDYLNDGRFGHDPVVDAAVREEGIRSIIGVPMTEGPRVIGVLFVADRVVRAFTDADVDVLSSLAHHAAIALRKAELYDRATGALAKLERSNRLVQVQNRRLQRAEDLHAQLTQAMLAGRGLPDIVGLIADFVHQHVVVLDGRLRLLADAGRPEDAFGRRLVAEGPERAMRRRRDVRKAVRTVQAREPTVLPAAPPERSHARLILPIAARDEVLGSIWVAVRADALPDDRPLIEQAARVVALDLLKDRAVSEVERRTGRELLDALLAEHPDPDGGLERRAAELGIDLAGAHRVLVVQVAAPSGDGAANAAAGIRDEVLGALRRQRWCPFVAEYGTLVVGLVPGADAPSAETLRRILESAARGAARAVMSPPCEALGEYRPQFVAARRVLALVAEDDGPAVLDLDDAWLLTLLFRGGTGGRAELRRFVQARIGPLLRHDEEHGLCLVSTLAAYLAADRSPTRTAAALHVHVNTVYYRLERLKAILGDDFGEPRRALDLQVALVAHRLLGGRPPA